MVIELLVVRMDSEEGTIGLLHMGSEDIQLNFHLGRHKGWVVMVAALPAVERRSLTQFHSS